MGVRRTSYFEFTVLVSYYHVCWPVPPCSLGAAESGDPKVLSWRRLLLWSSCARGGRRGGCIQAGCRDVYLRLLRHLVGEARRLRIPLKLRRLVGGATFSTVALLSHSLAAGGLWVTCCGAFFLHQSLGEGRTSFSMRPTYIPSSPRTAAKGCTLVRIRCTLSLPRTAAGGPAVIVPVSQ